MTPSYPNPWKPIARSIVRDDGHGDAQGEATALIESRLSKFRVPKFRVVVTIENSANSKDRRRVVGVHEDLDEAVLKAKRNARDSGMLNDLANEALSRAHADATNTFRVQRDKQLTIVAVSVCGGIIAGAALGPIGLLAAAGIIVLAALHWHLSSRRLDPYQRQPASIEMVAGEHQVKIVAEARRTLAALTAAAAAIECPEARSRLERVVASGEALIDQVASSSDGARPARRTLALFLDGIAQVSAAYSRLTPSARTPDLDDQFLAALNEVESQLERERERIHHAAAQALDVRIDVLRQQLRYENPSPILIGHDSADADRPSTPV